MNRKKKRRGEPASFSSSSTTAEAERKHSRHPDSSIASVSAVSSTNNASPSKISLKDTVTLAISVLALLISGVNFVLSQVKEAQSKEIERLSQQKKMYSAFLLGIKTVEAAQQKNTGLRGTYESRALVALVDAQASAKDLDINFDLPAWFNAIYKTEGLNEFDKYDAEIDLRNRISEQVRTKYSARFESAFSLGATFQWYYFVATYPDRHEDSSLYLRGLPQSALDDFKKQLSNLGINHSLTSPPTDDETTRVFRKNLDAIRDDVTRKWNP